MPTIREQLASLFGLSTSDPKPEKPIAIESKKQLPRRKRAAESSSVLDSPSVSKKFKGKKKRGTAGKKVARGTLKLEKAGSIRYMQNVSLENIHNAYNPKQRTVVKALLTKTTAAASRWAPPSSRQSNMEVILCKFCEHPAMPGDGICRQCSSE